MSERAKTTTPEEEQDDGYVRVDARLLDALRVVAPHLRTLTGLDVDLELHEGADGAGALRADREVELRDGNGDTLARVWTRLRGNGDGAQLPDDLQTSEATYRTLLERANLGMALLDADLRARHVNGPLRDILGRDPEPGTRLSEMVVDDDRPGLCQHMEERTRGGGDTIVLSLHGARGPKPVTLLGTPLGDEPGSPSGWAVIVRDRSREIALEEERQALSQRVQQAEKMAAMGKFVAGIAHELNNPLTVVIGYTELLAETTTLPAHQRASLQQVLLHARRAGRIVEDLLKFSHHEEARSSPVCVRSLIDEARAAVTGRQEPDVTLIVDVPDDLPPVAGSKHALAQVFRNVLENALDAVRLTDPPHRVGIRATREEATQRVEVWDTGPGIPEPDRVFDPFYTTKPIGKGTGLGLSICYGIVRDHNGELFAENPPEGGARMTIVLPEGQPESEVLLALPGVGSEGAESPPSIAPETRLLVVDDEPAILRLASDSLTRFCEVTTAETVEEAVRILDERSFDVVLTDLRLPDGLTGADFYEIIQERWPELVGHVAFMTGDTVNQASQAFLDRVRRPCLKKPFKLSQLTAFVQALLDP